jgi:hypothetical protein
MSKKPLLLTLLSLLVPAPALVAGPPQGPSGRLVQDPVPALTAEVKRVEKEVARDPRWAEELDVARARLAAAQGRTGEARAAWQQVIATRVARLDVLLSGGLDCDPSYISLFRGSVAEARCGLAEAEGDRVALSRELPKVVTYREAQLAHLRRRAQVGTISTDDFEQGEKSLLKKIRQAQQRLDAVKRR